jgi:NodT family efflux transporter outer membrane factor (OMF) lipoprotein
MEQSVIIQQMNRDTIFQPTTMKKSYFYIIPFLLVILAACNVAKDTSTPKPDLPTQFRNENAATGVAGTSASDTIPSGSVADLPWKNFFQDTTLQRLIDTAIAKNFDMQLAIKNIETARLLLKQSRWGYVPDVSLQVSGSSNRPSDNSLNGLSASEFLKTTHIEDFSANVSLSWEADIWGKIKNRKAGALAGYLQSEEARKAIQTDLVAAVSQAYYNLLMLDAQMEISRKNIRLSDSTLRIIRFQYDAGQVTALAVQQAEAQLNTASALIPQLEKNITLQENALRVLSAELPEAVTRNAILASMDITDSLAAGVPSELVSRRPDVRRQELELAVANAQVGIARANMYPALRITASGGLNSFKASNWFNIPASLFGAVAGSVVQPVLQKKQLKTDYEIAKVRREQSVIEFRQSVLYAVGEVSDALVKIEKLQTEQDIVKNRVALLQNATSNARQLFSSGMANYLEVITAQGNVLQSELELAALTRDHLGAKVELYRSLGGGWK